MARRRRTSGSSGGADPQFFSGTYRMPVPRGAKIHLCVPAAAKSAPSCESCASWLPKPCTASRTTRMRFFSPRPALTSATAFVSARTGSLTPLLECTQVMPTTRVFGPMARFRFSDDFVDRCSRRIGVQRHAPPGRAGFLGGEANRLVMHVVVVRRAEDFVARLQRQPLVDEGKPLGRAVRERDLFGLPPTYAAAARCTRTGNGSCAPCPPGTSRSPCRARPS